MRRVVNPRDTPILGAGGCWTNPKGLGSNGSYLVSWQTAYQVAVERDHGRLRSNGEAGLRPESCWNDCLTRRKSIRLCVPSHIAYEVGAARQQTVRSPRTMDPHSQEWHRNREATVYLPA